MHLFSAIKAHNYSWGFTIDIKVIPELLLIWIPRRGFCFQPSFNAKKYSNAFFSSRGFKDLDHAAADDGVSLILSSPISLSSAKATRAGDIRHFSGAMISCIMLLRSISNKEI